MAAVWSNAVRGVLRVALADRVLYSVRMGQSFGESVLTGRRRNSTMRAVSSADMFTLSAENLQELFLRR